MNVENLIDKFIIGVDRSIRLAGELEVALDVTFPNDDYIQDVIEILASYRPGGGDYLYDEEQVIQKLKQVKEVYLN